MGAISLGTGHDGAGKSTLPPSIFAGHTRLTKLLCKDQRC